MKSLSTKIPAIIAMLISVFSFVLLISAFAVSTNESPRDMGVSRSFALWVFAVIFSMISLLFYSIDAIFSAVKIFLKIHPIFNSILALILIGAIPMVIFIGGSLGINIYIWFSYYLLMFALEIVSIIKHIKIMKDVSKVEK
jgi:hypothetical protein